MWRAAAGAPHGRLANAPCAGNPPCRAIRRRLLRRGGAGNSRDRDGHARDHATLPSPTADPERSPHKPLCARGAPGWDGRTSRPHYTRDGSPLLKGALHETFARARREKQQAEPATRHARRPGQQTAMEFRGWPRDGQTQPMRPCRSSLPHATPHYEPLCARACCVTGRGRPEPAALTHDGSQLRPPGGMCRRAPRRAHGARASLTPPSATAPGARGTMCHPCSRARRDGRGG